MAVMAAIQSPESPSQNLSINGSEGWAVASIDRLPHRCFQNSANLYVTAPSGPDVADVAGFLLDFHRDVS